jgi:hypothetical protein
MNKRICLSTTGTASLMLGVAAGTSGITLACTGQSSPGVGMMIACAALMYIAQEAFGRMRPSWKMERGE